MAVLEIPSYFPYRLILFRADGAVTIKAYNDRVVRDREARELPDGVPALAVDVVFTVSGGDYPSGVAEPPKTRPKSPVRNPRRPR